MENKILGDGSYGIVTLIDGYAVKKYKDNKIYDHSFIRELICIKNLSHESIVEYYSIDIKHKTFKMKYYNYTFIDCIQQTLTCDIIDILYQLMDVIKYIESQNICHRDIKPSNILINNIDTNSYIKLCDWSLSRSISDNSTEFYTDEVETEWYRSPELKKEKYIHYNHKIEIYAIGIMLIQYEIKQYIKITTSIKNKFYREQHNN